MLLERLRDYGTRTAQTEPVPSMYTLTPVRYQVELDKDGHLLGIVDLSDPGRPGGKQGLRRLTPTLTKTSGVRAKLLADTAEYALGIARDPAKQLRVNDSHKSFKDLVARCGDQTGDPTVRAVQTFLELLDPAALELPDNFDAGGVVSFRVDGVDPVDLPAVREFWAANALGGMSSESAQGDPPSLMQCLVCGRDRPALERLPLKIKGIPNGQTSGLAIISANADAFLSYGLEASQIAPTCLECCESFSNGLNDLLRKRETSLRVGSLAYVFWTREEPSFSFADLLSQPDPTQVRAMLDAARSGKRATTEVDATPFYAAALSASGARVVVRDWLDTTVERARANLARYFRLQEIVDQTGEPGRPMGIYALGAATVRDPGKGLSPETPKALLRLALAGGRLPRWLLYQAVRRNQVEGGVTRQRAALIKMVLASDAGIREGDTLVELDAANRDPAYLCGRLLAVLENVQRAALPGINDSVTDRFFGSASSAPASVFGRLLQGARPHLAKLRRDRKPTHDALQRRLEEVMVGLPSFPRTLTLEQQGLFALGYWHQQAAERASRQQAMARREATKQQGQGEDPEPDE
jgi:CRISPR-associated protein Csd1